MDMRHDEIFTLPRPLAIALNRKRYYTGELCRNGHDAERLVSNGKCVRCESDRMIAYAKTNKDYAREKSRRARERYRLLCEEVTTCLM